VQSPPGPHRTSTPRAALGGHDYICLQLLNARCPVDSADGHGRTPLQYSAFGGFLNCASVLLAHGANPNAVDREGISALHWASSAGQLDIVRLLVDYGAHVSSMEADGDKLTPLDYAMIGGGAGTSFDAVVDFLLSCGALSGSSIKDLAALSIQRWWRGRKIVKAKQAQKRDPAAKAPKGIKSPPPGIKSPPPGIKSPTSAQIADGAQSRPTSAAAREHEAERERQARRKR
jgi:hypothetical protein